MEYLTSVGLPIIEEADHRLLDAPAPDYTVATVRRAFIVWLYCGQKNRFRDVCDYYHRLEKLEDKMSPEQRAASRHHEFNLFSQQPPTSSYLKKNHPTLYTQTHIENHYLKKIEAIKNQCVYENLTDKTAGVAVSTSVTGVTLGSGITSGSAVMSGSTMTSVSAMTSGSRVTSGATKQEIVDASQAIKNYCLKHKVSLKDFLESFKEYAEKCGVKSTVGNIEAYIKRKMVEKELDLVVEYSEKVGTESKDSKPKETANVNKVDAESEKNKTIDDENECRIIAESTVKDLIDFNDNEDKIAKKSPKSVKSAATKTNMKINKSEDSDKENRAVKVQKANGAKEDTFSKEDLEDSFKSIEDCDESCVNRNTAMKEIDLNVNGEAKPIALLKRDRKHEANMKLLNTSFQDMNFAKIHTLT